MSSAIPPTAEGIGAVASDSQALTGLASATEPTVMVIDDSLAVRTILEASFHRIGVRVTAFPDGIAAIQALTKGEATVPNVLLLDINLPRMDGYEVARILRGHEQFSNTTILMLTGRDGFVDRMKSRWVGAREFIRKPFRVSEVVRTVCSYLHLELPGISESTGVPRG